MDAEKPSGRETVEGIEIDYDNLDVAEIMDQIKIVSARMPVETLGDGPEKDGELSAPPEIAAPPAPTEPVSLAVTPAADRPAEPALSSEIPSPSAPTDPASPAVTPAADRPAEPVVSTPAPEPAGPPPVPPVSGAKAALKVKFSRLIRPFAPAIRLLGLPLQEDIQAAAARIDELNRRASAFEQSTDHRLDGLQVRTDQRLDDLQARMESRIDDMQGRTERRVDDMQARTDQRLDDLQVRTERRMDDMQDRSDGRFDALQEQIDARFHEVRTEIDDFRDRLDQRLVDLDRSMDYVKLLYNLDHNLVVEMTKLRIEFETLKSKVRILEKDLDTQLQRERVLEKRFGS